MGTFAWKPWRITASAKHSSDHAATDKIVGHTRFRGATSMARLS